MYWLAVFAVIMEIVFRIRDNQTKSAESKDIANKKMNKNRVRFADYENNDFQNDWPTHEYLESETILSDNRYYRIKNEKDNLFLTLQAVQIQNCLYRIIHINGTNDCNWTRYTVYLGTQNRAYTSQLWQIESRGPYTSPTNFLIPANVIIVPPPLQPNQNLNWMSNRYIRRWNKKIVITTTTPSPLPLFNAAFDESLDSNDYNLDRLDTTTTTTISPQQPSQPINDDDNSIPDSPATYSDYQNNNPDLDSFRDVRKRRKRQSADSTLPCGRNETKMIWKLKWRVVKTSSLTNLKHGHFEIRGPNKTCIILNGFIGECGQPESTWTFYSVAVKNKVTSAKYFHTF